ncbi:MAG: cyclic nucleotide-binding domain-containing protein [Candidatus Gracilibacteria bacterium]
MSNLKIFNGIDNEVVDKILSYAPMEIFNSSDVIFNEGELSNGKSYIIKYGIVEVEINGNKIAELGDGEMFGEIALLNEEVRTATVKAITNVELIVLTLSDLIDMINNDDNIINKQIIRRIEENLKLLP